MIIREFGHACGLVCNSRSASSFSFSCGCAWARIISVAAVEREIPAWQWISSPPCFGRVAAESQNSLDVPFLRQENVWIRLDRIMKAQGRAKMRIVRQKGFRIRPFRVEYRKNVGDPSALVTDEFVKSANGEGWEGGRLHGAGP